MTISPEEALATLRRAEQTMQAARGELTALRSDLDSDRKASVTRDKALSDAASRERRYLRLTIWSLVLNSLLTVATIVATIVAFAALSGEQHALSEVRHNSATITQLHEAQVSVCSASNTRLLQQAALWNYLLQKASPPPRTATPQQRRTLLGEFAHLRALKDAAFAPRNCPSLYSLKGH